MARAAASDPGLDPARRRRPLRVAGAQSRRRPATPPRGRKAGGLEGQGLRLRGSVGEPRGALLMDRRARRAELTR